MHSRMNGWLDGYIDIWMNGWMDECIDIPVIVAVIAVHTAGTNDPSESANTINQLISCFLANGQRIILSLQKKHVQTL